MNVKEFLQYCGKIAPFELQENWDNSGSQIIFPDCTASNVLIATDFTTQTLKEAIKKKCQVIVVHHPPIFKPIKFLDNSLPLHKLLILAIQNQISVIALHTNFDANENGMNEYLLKEIGIKNTQPFLLQPGNYSKMVVFTPKSHTEIIRNELCQAGAGHIGNYSDCTFRTTGLGTFKGQKDTKPFIGKIGVLETAEEDRLEIIIKNSDKDKIIQVLLKIHPYEEVAYDLIPLANEKPSLGRIGFLEKKLTPINFITLLQNKLKIKNIRYSQHTHAIKKIAVITGGAGAFYRDAIKAQCDAYISGDIKHNEWIEANETRLLLVDGSHYGTERLFAPCLIKNLNNLKINPFPRLIQTKSENFPFTTL